MNEQDEAGLTKDQFKQSVKNFLTLHDSIVEQAGISTEEVIESMLSACLTLLVRKTKSRESAAIVLLEIAEQLLHDRQIHH